MNHELLRQGPGDQTEILFYAPNAKTGANFWVYFGDKGAAEPKPWKAEAGVVMEVRKKADGSIEGWPEFQKVWNNSNAIVGRTLRSRIFDGYNPIGPNSYIATYYRAYFRVEKTGTYRFATNSDDASFLLVDGKLIAQFPGSHGANAGLGQHAGAADLREGVHELQYYHCQLDNDMVTTAAWAKPDDKYFSLMDANVFVPIGRAKAQAIEAFDGHPLLDFSFAPRDHQNLNGRYIVRYNFECDCAYAGSLEIDYGDGCKSTIKKEKGGVVETHGYILPGNYSVTISAESFAPIKQTVVVEPNWHQREEWDDNRWKEYRRGLLGRLEAGYLRPTETVVALYYGDTLDDKELIEKAATLAWKQAKQFSPVDQMFVFYTLGKCLQTELKQYEQAARAYREVIAGPADANLKEQSKLHLAGLLIHKLGKNQEGLDLLKNLDDKLLVAPNEPVLRQIYIADAMAGLGQQDEAIKNYEALHPVVNLADRKYALGRRARLLAVNSYIKKSEFDAALTELKNIEWETPRERMSDETGMLRVDCYLAQGDYDLAEILLKRLINMNAGSARLPEMLYDLIKAYKGRKLEDEATRTYARLKKEHPYAAETALAALLFK